jgi:hypothetical protein
MLNAPEPAGPGGKLKTKRTPSGVLPLCPVLLLAGKPVLVAELATELAELMLGVTASLDKGLVQLPPRCTNNCQPAKG